jgi:hypothetical protein
MVTGSQLLIDHRGEPLFRCSICGDAIHAEDFYDQGLRLPDVYETAEEYCEAELIDSFKHLACAAVEQIAR